MAKNVTIAGASYSSVPSIQVPQTGGGTATFYDCTGSQSITENGTVDVTGLAEVVVDVAGGGVEQFRYSGTNPELVAEYTEEWTLADTSFVVGSSASTSATSIKATVANRFTNTNGSPTYAYGDKDVVVVQRCYAIPTHEGGSGKAQQIKYVYEYVNYFAKRKTTDISAKTMRQVTSTSMYMNKYYNTSGAVTRAQGNYGFYMTPQAANLYSNTAASTYVRCNSPVLYYRASSTYESTANIKLATECLFRWELYVYVCDPSSTICSTVNDDLDDMLL